MDFLNKLFVKAIFSEAPELNITADDMGADMISPSMDGEVVSRIEAATKTIGSLSIYVPVTVNFKVLKTSPAADEYGKRVLQNGYIGGDLTVYTDVNTPYKIHDISISSITLGTWNGTEADVEVVLKGNLQVNSAALTY